MAVFSAITAAFTAFGTWFGSLGFLGQFAVRLAVGVAFNALSAALAGKPQQSRQGIVGQIQQGADLPRAFILGRYATAGSLVYHNTWGKVGKTPNAYYTRVTALSDLPSSGLVEVWIDDQRCTLDTGNPDPEGKGFPVIEFSETETKTRILLNGSDEDDNTIEEVQVTTAYAWIKFYDGSQSTADSFLTTDVSTTERPWEATEIGTGITYAVATFRFNRERFQGLPNVLYVLDGVPLYDPDGQGTGTGDDIPVVQAWNICAGIEYNGDWFYGAQNAAFMLKEAEWVPEIQACKADVPGAAGMTDPEKIEAFGSTAIPARYRAGREVRVNEEPADVIEDLASACNGRFADVGVAWRMQVGDPKPASFTFTDLDIVSTEAQRFAPFFPLSETVNGITAIYPEPNAAYADEAAPPLFIAALEAEDGGRRLPREARLGAVPYREQVQRLMDSAVKEARRARRHSVVMPAPYSALEVGEYGEWTSERNAYTTKLFRIDGTSDRPDGDIALDLTECDPSDYDQWSADTDYRPQPTGSLTPQPVPVEPVAGWSFVGISIEDGSGTKRRPALRMTWDGDRDGVRAFKWQIRLTATKKLVDAGSTDDVELGGLVRDQGVLATTGYEGRGRYVGRNKTAWTSWTPTTTPDTRISEPDIDPTIIADIDDAKTTATTAFNLADQTATDLLANTANLQGQITTLEGEVDTALDNAVALASLLEGVLRDPYLTIDGPQDWTNTPSDGVLTKAPNAVYPTGQSWRLQSTGTQSMGIQVESDRAIWIGDKNLDAVVIEVAFTLNTTTDIRAAGIRVLWSYDGSAEFVTDVQDLSELVDSEVATGTLMIARGVFVRETDPTGPGVLDFLRCEFNSSSPEYSDGVGGQHDQDITVHKIFIRRALEEEKASGRVAAAIDSAIQTLRADIETHTGVSLSASLSTQYYTIVAGDAAISAAIQQLQALIEDPNGTSLGATVEANRLAQVAGDNALAADIVTLQATIEDPQGTSLGATVETNRLAQVAGDDVLAAKVDRLQVNVATNTIAFQPSELQTQATEEFWSSGKEGEPLAVSNLDIAGTEWAVLADGVLRYNTPETLSPNAFTRRVINCEEGDRVRAKVSLFVAQGADETAIDAFAFRFVWLDENYDELSSDFDFADVLVASSGGRKQELISYAETADANAKFCRVAIYIRDQFGTPAPLYINVRKFTAENVTDSQNLAGQITNILALEANTLAGTVMGTWVTAVSVDADGNPASPGAYVAGYGTAIDTLEGNASAIVGFEAGAGTEVSLLQLISGSGDTNFSVARLAADDILLDGTVTARELSVTEGWGNIVHNGKFANGDLRGYQNIPSNWEVRAKTQGTGPSALQNAPTPFVLLMPQDGSDQEMDAQDFSAAPGEQFSLRMSYATGGASRDASLRVRVRWENADGTFLSNDNLLINNASGTVWTDSDASAPKIITAPAGAAIGKVKLLRIGGGAGDAYVTNVEVTKLQNGATIIRDGTITTVQLNAASISAGGIDIINGTVESSNYAEDGGGIPTAGFQLDAAAGTIKGKELIGRNIMSLGAVSDFPFTADVATWGVSSLGVTTVDTWIIPDIEVGFAILVMISFEFRARPNNSGNTAEIKIARRQERNSVWEDYVNVFVPPETAGDDYLVENFWYWDFGPQLTRTQYRLNYELFGSTTPTGQTAIRDIAVRTQKVKI